MTNYKSEHELSQEFSRQFNVAKKKYCKRPNILICGYTGSGKSSLAQMILGKNLVPSHHIGAGAPKTMEFKKYESSLITLWDSKGQENGQAEDVFMKHTRDFIRSRREDTNPDNHIHLIWYTIQGPGARVTDCDINLIRNIFMPHNVIVAITKADMTRDNQMTALKSKLMQDAGLPAERIIPTSDEEGGRLGAMEIVNQSMKMIPNAYQDAFAMAQQVDLERRVAAVMAKQQKAKDIILTATRKAGVVGAVPLPFSDAVLLVPAQLTMIATLAVLYDQEEASKDVVLPFIAPVVGVMAATSLTKFFPGVGSMINAGVATAITGAMGWYIQHRMEAIALAKVRNQPVPEMLFDVASFMNFYQQYKKN